MFAVVFEVNPRAGAWDDYLGHAAILRPELLDIAGFIANERYASLTRPGWLVSLSVWRDEKALVRWRTHALHHAIQGKGRSSVFADYHLRVGEIVADTAEPGPLSQSRFDTTERGPGKAVTLTERVLDNRPVPGDHGGDMVADGDIFESLTRPGNGLYLRSWPDVASAGASIGQTPGRGRAVSVIRDYGMFDRTEAPQYFPP